MKKMLKFRYILLAVWFVVTVLFVTHQPNLKKILNQKGQATISQDSPSLVAADMLNKMGKLKGDTVLFVFYDKNKLSADELGSIKGGIGELNHRSKELMINAIMDPFNTPEAKDQLVSKDGTTLIVQVAYEKGTRDNETIMDGFQSAIKDVKGTHYITGQLAINNDYLAATNKGVDKSSVITVIFILLVLILMFRSVVTPLVSLFAVGIAYACSMGIIGILIHVFNFPITNLTQMFIILVLFGIGTDYNILLFNRFKEELGHGASIEDAIVNTYRTAGKTVIFSGLTVFMAFASLSFVQFAIYRSANAVAIGIAVLLLELMTLTPLLMRVVGGKLFWPSKKSSGHKESKVWGAVTENAGKHPAISILVVAAIITPVILFNSTKLSFDSLKDLSADTPSVKGFNLVAEKFGRGKVMPTTVVIEDQKAMDNNEALSAIDSLTEKLKALPNIDQVSSVTQPKGEQIKNFYTSTQTKTVVAGLNSANDGVLKIKAGLGQIDKSLASPDFSGVKKLSDGTGAIENGLDAIAAGLQKVNGGIDAGAAGADKLAAGIAQLKTGVASINTGLDTISGKLAEIQGGYTKLGQGYAALPGSITQLKQLVTMMNGTVAAIGAKLPKDANVLTLKGLLSKLSDALDAMNTGISTANTNYNALTAGLGQLNDGLKAMVASTSPQSQLVAGIGQLSAGNRNLAEGLRKGSKGQKTIISSLAQLEAGAGKVKAGQDQLYTSLNSLGSGMAKLKDGISKSSSGLGAINNGIAKTNAFLNQLSTAKSFYIPKEAFGTKEISKMFDAYMSSDRKITKLTIYLKSDPYSKQAINGIDPIHELVKNQLKGTVLSKAEFGIAGPTSNTNDLNKIATHDITFTQVIVLICIFLLLVLVIRSFWIPVFIVGSLVAAYYTAISFTAYLVSRLFTSMDGMSWNVPFFSFVVIASLGVDYSIFLMTRFKEYPNLKPTEAMVMAAKNVGGVVVSAAVILGGTFATLYPSNVHVLMELAICVVIGLFMLSVILLPVLIPALISLNDRITRKKDVGISQ